MESEEEEIMYIHKVVDSKAPLEVEVEVERRKIKFEVDTGSGISIISGSTFQKYFAMHKLEHANIVVKTYSNERLSTLGKFKVNVKYGDKDYSDLTLYVIQGNGVNLLGRNWLQFITLNWAEIFRIRNGVNDTSCKNVRSNTALDDLVQKHAAIFSEQLGTIKGLKAKLHIKSEAKPRYCKARNVPFALTKDVEDEIDRLEQSGVIKSVSTSEWASPVVILPKPDGSIRLCGDYKSTVNPVIENEVYPQPTPDEIFAKMRGGQKFSKIDLTQAYAQVELDEESKKYLTINTSKGLKEPSRMPYGIKPATGIFQRHVENKLSGTERTAVKVDDILISEKNDNDHLGNLGKVFETIEEMGATVNKKKCVFFADEVEYVGFIIDKNGVRLTPSKIEAICKIPEPTNIKELQSFIGGINYYARFIPNMSSIAKPLYRLIEKDTKWSWNGEEQEAFDTLKSRLCKSPVLCLYQPELPLVLACDASCYGLGAVVSHIFPDGSEKPIAFASRTLNSHEVKYSQVDKEGAAVMFGIKKFNQYVLGRKFTIVTDNKAIQRIFDPYTAVSAIAAARLTRWSLMLSQYDYSIEFKSTKSHGNADMLSRLPLQKESKSTEENVHSIQIAVMPVTDKEIKFETQHDEILKNVIQYLKNDSWPAKVKEEYKPYYDKRHELSLEDDIILWGLRVVIPKSLRCKILEELHVQHPGIVRMKALSRIHVWYPKIDKDIESLVKQCEDCSRVANEPPKSVPHPWDWPTGAMDRIHVDYFEYERDMFLIMVDSFSKWVDV